MSTVLKSGSSVLACCSMRRTNGGATRESGINLINRAIDFCKSKGYKKTYLWYFEGLNAARHLYEEVGFKLIKQQSGVQWGPEVTEQYFELRNE